MRSRRVLLAIGGILVALLLLGGGAVFLALRSAGWSPGGYTVRVIGSAMAPTVIDGDYLVVQTYAGGSVPLPGDVVVLRSPYDSNVDLVKRVVAGPGQTVLIRSAQLFVDGRPVSEPYAAAQGPWTVGADWPPAGAPVVLGPGDYFVLGDNRNHSSDSRVFGPVRLGSIRGRAVSILAPSARARRL